jgi:hypothetical protein
LLFILWIEIKEEEWTEDCEDWRTGKNREDDMKEEKWGKNKGKNREDEMKEVKW